MPMNLPRLIPVCASIAWVLTLTIRVSPAADTFQVIEQRIIHKDGRAITFNRVVPPLSPTAPVSDTKVAAVSVAQESKDHQMFSISATVYDRKITELRWFKDGKSFHAWSNVDFNFIAGMGSFETTDTIYSLVLGLGNEMSPPPSEATTQLSASGEVKSLPAWETFPSGQFGYILIQEGSASVHTAQDVAAMDALHHYYEVNRDKLKQAYAEREAKRIAQEQWQKDHPPVPQDTVTNFWPIKSKTYLGKGAGK